jgi:hypothetical protein
VGDVEAGLLYHNFVVVGGVPRVKTRAAGGQGDVVVDVVTGGVFGRLAGEVLERLGRDGLVVLVGPHGVGKSTLAAYAAWLALWRGAADAVVSAEEVKTGFASALENLQRYTGRRFLLLYDPVPVTAYYEPHAVGDEAEKEKARVRRAVEEALRAAGRGVKALVVLPDEPYRDLPSETKEAVERYVVKAVLNDVEFLHEVVRRYSGCGGDYSKLAEEIAQFNGGYTLAAKYAGLWLRERGCDVSDVERAVEEAKSQPKLFLAHYIWHVLLKGRGDLAKKAAVPLLFHARFGPVPVCVTYITKAVNDRGIWRFLKPEELQGVGLEYLREDELEPIAKWLAQQHEDIVRETLRDLAGLNGEEARKPYREALGDLIKALDWARDEVLKEGAKTLAEVGIPKEALKVCNKIFAKLGVPEKDLELGTALLVFVARRLAAVFRGDESKGCWQRVAFIAGHALARYPKLLKREQLAEDVVKTLGDALKPCAVDKYLVIDGKIPWFLIHTILFLHCVEARRARDRSQIREIRQRSSVLTPFAYPVIIIADWHQTARKTAEGLLAKWRERGVKLAEALYALGLAALAAVGEVDEETADLLLRVAFIAVKRATRPALVLSILTVLRLLGEKAPHIYVSLLAAVSELKTLDQETVQYIYDALQQLKDRLLKTGRLWPLVEAIRAYTNLLIKHSAHLKNRWEEAVKDMWQLYSKIRERCGEAAPGGDLLAQCLFDAIVRACVLAVTLCNDELTQVAQKYFGDLVKEAEAVRNVLDKVVAHPEELERIMGSDADLAEWVKLLGSIDDAVKLIKRIKKHVPTLYEQRPALCEVYMSDRKNRKNSHKRSKRRKKHA